MNLGIFLSPADSFTNMGRTGQDVRFVKYFIEGYSKAFKKIYVFTYDDETYDLPKNVELIVNKTKMHRLLYALLLPIINREKLAKCDVVRGFGLASALSAFFLNKKFVFNWAYDYINFVKVENKRRYILPYIVLEKLAFWRANKVFVQTKEKLMKLSGDKFVYLPNGVDLKVFKKGRNNIYKLVFIGRLEKQKNLPFLIDAVGELPESKRKLLIIGNGSLENQIKAQAKKKNIDLEIVSKIQNSKLPPFLGKYQIFVLSSFYEGVPKVLQEAMALGCVPVVTNFPTAKEVVDNGKDGIITDFDKRKFSQAILDLIEDRKLLKKLSLSAVRKIKTQFDINMLLEREIEVIKHA